ncbi:MAG: YfcE family phosphodiesterase [Promethearchaeota archaeon]
MAIKILIIGDTHISNFQDLPEKMLQLIQEADWVIHVGDYTSLNVLSGLMKIKGPRFKGVYGNADPLKIRERISAKEILEISHKRIGITHPSTGGTYENTKKKVIMEFKDDEVDAIIYGHTHDALIEHINGILLVNPGKGYLEKNYFGPPTSVAILNIERRITGKIEIIQR